jgi:hypothetical protein
MALWTKSIQLAHGSIEPSIMLAVDSMIYDQDLISRKVILATNLEH